MTDDYSSVLSIEVSLAPPQESDVLSLFSSAARPRPSNIDAFYADPAQLDHAMDELRRLGFRVLIGSWLELAQLHELLERPAFVAPAFGDHEGQELAENPSAFFACIFAEAAPATPQSLALLPPFAPAACW